MNGSIDDSSRRVVFKELQSTFEKPDRFVQQIEIAIDETNVRRAEQRQKKVENVLIVQIVTDRMEVFHQTQSAQFVFVDVRHRAKTRSNESGFGG